MAIDRIIIFGAGGNGRKIFHDYNNRDDVEIIAFVDNYKTGNLFGLPIIKPGSILKYEFDYIIIASVAAQQIEQQLIDIGIQINKLKHSYTYAMSKAREIFLKNFAKEAIRKNLSGNVAEAGVFQGDFAALINGYFPDKKLYLFDTFKGFDSRDIEHEEGYYLNPQRGEYFSNTSIELVLSKMKNPENCLIRRGFLPETLAGIDDKFFFVNLDMDLYQPTLIALEWFWPRMTKEGIILIHDYFDDTGTYPNLRKGVIQFTSKNNILSLPIGDDLSIALIKD